MQIIDEVMRDQKKAVTVSVILDYTSFRMENSFYFRNRAYGVGINRIRLVQVVKDFFMSINYSYIYSMKFLDLSIRSFCVYAIN